MKDEASLRAVKSLHTVVWAFFVACIFGAPIAAARGQFALAGVLVGLVVVEGLVLLVNGWGCPLTAVASRYTERREENFDIYLPRWLAKHNKSIFTPLFVVGAAYTAIEWWRHG
jgi:polyferredoxin